MIFADSINTHLVYAQESKDKKILATIINYHYLVIFGNSNKGQPLIFINSESQERP